MFFSLYLFFLVLISAQLPNTYPDTIRDRVKKVEKAVGDSSSPTLTTTPPLTSLPTGTISSDSSPTHSSNDTETPTHITSPDTNVTTLHPTTATPSTSAPNTVEPTTQIPTTEIPTTIAPTTEVPTTELPSTEPPSPYICTYYNCCIEQFHWNFV